MAPNPEVAAETPKYCNDDDVVITGISGRLPHCETFEEFKQKLFDGTDILADGESRWPDGYRGAYTKIGVVGGLWKFDSTFFNVHPKLAEKMDPQIRIMLESTYEAFVDAGMNPTSLRGSNTAVVVGTTNNDCADWWSVDPNKTNGYEFLGNTRTMFPNRVSYSFDLKGPSYSIDSGSSGSLLAFEHAYRMLKQRTADGVVVIGTSLLLNPVLSNMMQKMDYISPEGISKPFDASGCGSVRSDAVVVVYLQRAKDAKRVYATAVNASTNNEGFRLEGVTYPTNTQQIELFKEVLNNAKVDPADVEYVESSACGNQLGDAQELNAVTEVYCKNRTKPLLIGSIKSNIGDSEPASGLCGVMKMALAMDRKEIPPTLHYSSPNPQVPALKDGRIQVVSKSLPWKGQYAAVNAVGIGGLNANTLLKVYENEKKAQPQDPIPRLVTGSARTDSAMNYMLNRIENMPRDPEFYGLLNGVQSKNIPGHNYRGYSIIGEENSREVSVLGVGKRQVWYVFSGMGSQWTGMGRDLLALPPFRESIEKTAGTLKTLGLDLYGIFNSNDKTVFDNVLNSFVGIAAIQIGLVDVLSTIGVTPDGIIGHSVGELACAYADGTLTAEQTMIVAYWRGRSLLDLNLAPGAMAAVGLSWEEANARVPSDIAVACHNSEDGVTISGPPDSIAKFVSKLKSDGVFAREVNSSGIAFHSWYIAAAGPAFKEKVTGVIGIPKARSPKWISTSIPESRWNEPLAQFSSVSYHVNNLVSPVLFNSALKHVPDNSVVIEIAPHALLQAILKPSVGPKCAHVGLVRRNQSTVSNLLCSIGRLFNAGLQLKLENLYPPISYPVSRGTPSLQPLVEWDHSVKWDVVSFIENEVASSGEVILEIDVEKETHSYLRGTFVDGVEVFPYAAYITFVWTALAKLQQSSVDKIPVVFDNVQFLKTIPVPKNGKIDFIVNILAGTGEFDVRDQSDSVIVSGFIKIQTSDEQMQLPELKVYEIEHLKTADVYQDLTCKGYKYSKSFQGINVASNNGNCGNIAFDGKWAPFIESLLQLHLLKLDTRDHYAIKYLFKLSILPEKQYRAVSSNGASFSVYENIGVIKSGGVEIRDVRSTLVSVRKELQQDFDLESYVFVPFVPEEPVGQPLNNIVQIVLENASESFDVTEVVTVQQEILVSQILNLARTKSPYSINANVYAKDINRFKSEQFVTYYEQDVSNSVLEQQAFFVVANGAIENKQLLNNVLSGVENGGFLLTVERNAVSAFRQTGADIVAKYSDGQNYYVLLKKNIEAAPTPITISVKPSFSWIESLKSSIQNVQNCNRNIVLISQNLENTGVIGFTRGLRQEPNGRFVKCVSIKDNKAPAFSASTPLYQEQLKKGLAVNMYHGGVWGTCVFVPYQEVTVQVEHAFINTTKVGDVNSLRLIEGKLPTINHKEQYPDYELCYPYYVPLNGLDVKFVKGTLPYNGISGDLIQQGSYLGMEFSGRDSSGKRIIGLVPGGALATSVLVHKDLVWQIPDDWSLEEACTVPRTYSLAYYALAVRGNVRAGESVYVHAGASGICTAAIAVALELGAIPYVGVFNKQQKAFLKSIYPQLNDDSFADLADNGGFEQHVLEQTEGRGVDLIFDTYSVVGKRQEFVDSLAEYGRLVDFEVFAPVSDSLGVSGSLKSVSHSKISLSTIHFSPSEIKYIQRLVGQGIANESVRPLETTVFPIDRVAEAFEYNVNCASNLGRTVVEIRAEEKEKKNAAPAKKLVTALPRLFFSSDKSFVISGDEDSLSLELIQHLAHRGARKFVFVSKVNKKPSSGYTNLTLKRLKNKNVTVVVSLADPSTVKGAEDVLREAMMLGPICGIYYISTAPATGLLPSLSENDFVTAKTAVSNVVANFDTLSRKLIPQLEYFVVLAPSVASRGSRVRSNYVYANADLVRLAEVRKISGYPAVVIEYGAVDGSSDSFNIPNFTAAAVTSALNILDNAAKNSKKPTVTSFSKYNGPNLNEDTDAATPVLLNIAKTFGFKSLSEIEPTFSLAQLGLDPILVPSVQKVLREQANVSVEIEELRLLTFPAVRAKINASLA